MVRYDLVVRKGDVIGNGNEKVNILRLRMRNKVCYQNKLYWWPIIDERIEYVCKVNNKIK